MKRLIPLLFPCVLFLAMLLRPAVVFAGAAEGLLLWFRTVVPTLFPFLVITTLLVDTGAVDVLSGLLFHGISPLFGVSRRASFAVLGGYLCGYPMGAKLTADLLRQGLLSPREGNYLLSFCNNASPMFVLSYLALQNLKKPELGAPSLAILLAASVLCSFLFRWLWRGGGAPARDAFSADAPSPAAPPKTLARALDDGVASGCESIARIGGYIIVFSILTALFRELPLRGPLWTYVLLPSLELTGGIPVICRAPLPFSVRYPLVMGLTAFGGICALFQTQCVARGQPLRLLPYAIEKLATASAASLLAYLYLQFL